MTLAVEHPAERHPALYESRRELERFDHHRERYERRDRVHALTRIGMPQEEIATVVGIHERQVSRDVSAGPPPSRPRLYNPDLASEARVVELESTADLTLRLAAVLREEDPCLTWGALTRLDRRQLQELAVIALAAIPVDSTPDQLLGWVETLAKEK